MPQEDGSTTWERIVAFKERAATLQGEGGPKKGHYVEIIGYRHERQEKGRDGRVRRAALGPALAPHTMSNEREPIRLPPYKHGPKPVQRAYERRVADDLRHPTQAALERVRAQQVRLEREFARPGRFALGLVVATPGAHRAMAEAVHLPLEFLLRTKQEDWGELPAVHEGSRILSAYRTRLDATLWVITEWDRSATTLLLPEEY